MEILSIIILLFLFAVTAIVLITIAIHKKSPKYLLGILACAVICAAGLTYFVPNVILKNDDRSPESITFSERLGMTIHGLTNGSAFQPYDPCLHSDFDGPEWKDEDVEFSVTQHFFGDFVLSIKKENKEFLIPKSHVKESANYFSLPSAATKLRNTLANNQPDPANGQMLIIEYTGVESIDNRPVFQFNIGHGDLNHFCKHYYKILQRAAVDSDNNVYLREGQSLHKIEDSTALQNPIEDDRDFGVVL